MLRIGNPLVMQSPIMPLQGGYLSEPSQLWAWVVFGGSLLSVQSFTEVTDICYNPLGLH